MAVEFANRKKKVLVTVREDLAHGFAYGDEDQKLDDYYPGDTLAVTEGDAAAFIAQGWVERAKEGARPGRAARRAEGAGAAKK
ncbi:MAG TPA: hypothetical protein VHU19_14260 [Pyrinomonadaceae bacterium]|jgi:hypothetical protein|nr:hypothetical protein [Pyrinomonadaceae bacterium]